MENARNRILRLTLGFMLSCSRIDKSLSLVLNTTNCTSVTIALFVCWLALILLHTNLSNLHIQRYMMFFIVLSWSLMLVPPLLRADNSLQIHWRTIHYFLHLLSWTLGLSLLRVFHSNRFWCSGQVLHQKKHLGKTGRLCEKFTTLRTRLNLKGWVLIQSLEIKEVKLATLSPLLLRKLGPFGPRSLLQSTKTTSFTNDYLLLFLVASIFVFR